MPTLWPWSLTFWPENWSDVAFKSIVGILWIAAYSYTDVARSVVCLSLSLSVCLYVGHTGELCRKGWIDRDAVWFADLCGSAEPCIRRRQGQIRVNPSTVARGDKTAMRPFAKLLWTVVFMAWRTDDRQRSAFRSETSWREHAIIKCFISSLLTVYTLWLPSALVAWHP